MPIYEYECRDCHCEFETLIRGESDRENNACPKCASKNLSKLLSVFGMGGGSGESGGGGCGTCSGGNCSTCR